MRDSIASATVPASATTWKPGRRSSIATRPWRTTSWSSTTTTVNVRGVASARVVTRFSVPPRPVERDPRSSVPCSGSRWRRPARAEPAAPRSHVGKPLVAHRRGWRTRRTPVRCRAPRRTRRPIRIGRRRRPRHAWPPEWRTTLLSASFTIPSRLAVTSPRRLPVGIVADPARGRSIELCRNSSTSAARPSGERQVPPSRSGRSPKMKLRMSRIVQVELSIARSTRRTTSSGSSAIRSGTSSSDRPTA